MGAADQRAIRTRADALDWGDEWVSAYAALQSHTEQLEHDLYMLQVRAFIVEHEALLLRYDMERALRSTLEPA